MCDKKYFTLDEAHRMLPKVKRFLARLHLLKAQINFLAEEKEAPIELTEPFSEEEIYQFAFAQEIKLNRELHKHVYEFFKTLDQLNDLGCILNDLDEGLVDFPFKMKNREAWLCWQEGEDFIQHWHEQDTGFDDRQPIFDLDEYYDER